MGTLQCQVEEGTYALGGSAHKCRSRSLTSAAYSVREAGAAMEDDPGAVKQKATMQMLLTRLAAALHRPGRIADFQFLRWAVTWTFIGAALAMGMVGLLADRCGSVRFGQDTLFVRGGGGLTDLRGAENPECAGRRVYMYDLPPQFNEDIMQRVCAWELYADGFCSNGGLGMQMERVMEPMKAWYRSEQYMLEPIIHEKFKRYRCLTKYPDLADLFYLPYYVGVDYSMTRFSDLMQVRDYLGERFVGWLMGHPAWAKSQGGRKHVLFLGRGIYDFTRQRNTSRWGNSLLSNPELENITRITVERVPYFDETKQMAVPFPTSFHPASYAEIELWRKIVHESKREKLVSFVGAPRNLTERPDLKLRDVLFQQCESSGQCDILRCDQADCRKNPQAATKVFLKTHFCYQPPGDSSTRKATFDCLIAGGIPVFFSRDAAWAQYRWHLPHDGSSYSILIEENEVMESNVNPIDVLASIPESRIAEMHDFIAKEILPRVVYDLPGAGRSRDSKVTDAFDIILEHFFDPSFQAYPSQVADARAPAETGRAAALPNASHSGIDRARVWSRLVKEVGP